MEGLINIISLPGFLLLMVWIAVWKGWALWKASKKDNRAWFIALLIINTLGILEILYIFVFSKMEKKDEISGN
jgi:hypothetical protein